MSRFTIMQRLKMLRSLERNISKYSERFVTPNAAETDAYKKATTKKILGGKYLFIEHFELIITTKCSLNCNKCSNLMPQYKEMGKGYFRDKEEIFAEIDTLTNSIDDILNCRVLGGEPLLHPNIDEILNYLLEKKSIGTLHIITNGTIIPNEKTLEVIKNPRVIVIFSDYGTTSKSMEKCVEVLNNLSIRNKVNSSLKWSDLGDLKKREVTKKELMIQRKNCMFCCKTYLNGRLHLCPRSAFGTDLGYFNYPEDYANLMEVSDVAIKRRRIAEVIYSSKFIDCCAHCWAGTSLATPIDPGVQI